MRDLVKAKSRCMMMNKMEILNGYWKHYNKVGITYCSGSAAVSKRVPLEMHGSSPPVSLLEKEMLEMVMQYNSSQDRQRVKRQDNRQKAIQKLAGDRDPKCEVCGCPHAETLHIGYKKHREGRFHRKKKGSPARNVVMWILRTPIEEVRELVQLECPFCNSYHNRFKEFPPVHKRPKW